MDDYPTYEEWIAQFDMENETPDMRGLEKYHFSELPVWSEGNVYLNGAQACRNEKNGFVNNRDSFFVELEEKDGKPVLKTNLYEAIREFRAGMIHTDTLGEAFEPEQKFENPDGTPITFDRDYFGNHRGLQVLPGPFAEASRCYEGLWTQEF